MSAILFQRPPGGLSGLFGKDINSVLVEDFNASFSSFERIRRVHIWAPTRASLLTAKIATVLPIMFLIT